MNTNNRTRIQFAIDTRPARQGIPPLNRHRNRNRNRRPWNWRRRFTQWVARLLDR